MTPQRRRSRSERITRAVDIGVVLFLAFFFAYLVGHIVAAVVDHLGRSLGA